MLQTNKNAWRKFCSLFLNLVKRGEGRETQNCPNNSFSHNFCHWLSEKSAKFYVCYITVAHFKSNWRHVFTHYVTLIWVLIIFGTQRSSLNTFIRQNLYFSDFFQIKPNYEHYKEDSTRCVIVHEIAALGT